MIIVAASKILPAWALFYKVMRSFCDTAVCDSCVVSRLPGGKPVCRFNNCDIPFSISDSGRLSMCAVSLDNCTSSVNVVSPDEIMSLYGDDVIFRCLSAEDKVESIGCDIQLISDRLAHTDLIARNLFSPSAMKLFTKDRSNERFFSLWTQTESRAKCTGRGITRNPVDCQENISSVQFKIESGCERYACSVAYMSCSSPSLT